MPRRTAYSPYDPEIVARWASYTTPMIVGGLLMVVSAVLFLLNLLLTHWNRAAEPDRAMSYADPLEPVVTVPGLLNGFAVWNWLVLVLMLIAFAYPIGQFFFIDVHEALPWGTR
jgi:cytochrome c oxidase subunit 1